MEAMDDSRQSNNITMSSEMKQQLCTLGMYAKYLGLLGIVQSALTIIFLVMTSGLAKDGLMLSLLVIGIGWGRLVMLGGLLILSLALSIILPLNMLRLNKVLSGNVNELDQAKVEEGFMIIKKIFMLTSIAFVVVVILVIFESLI
ncbi:MAG: hypothetical protein ACRCVU_17615 [Flavobacterium sp.]